MINILLLKLMYMKSNNRIMTDVNADHLGLEQTDKQTDTSVTAHTKTL